MASESDLSRGFGLLAAVAVATEVVVWSGAAIGAALSGHRLPGDASAVPRATAALPAHLSDPAGAWPSPTAADLPGPVLYWASTAAVGVIGLLLAAAGYHLWSRRWRVGQEPR